MRRNLYRPRGSTGSRQNQEINLRGEMEVLLHGGPGEIPHGRPFVIRTMRRDDDGNLIPCPCVDPITREPDPADRCPYCLSEGYHWDETWRTGYATYAGSDGGLTGRVKYLQPGSIRVDYRVFYFEYDLELSYDDKIVEVRLDVEGNPQLPYRREAIYKPQTIVQHRSDWGRVEYVAIFCREEDAIRP